MTNTVAIIIAQKVSRINGALMCRPARLPKTKRFAIGAAPQVKLNCTPNFRSIS